MASAPRAHFPGGSRNAVTRAGEAVRNNSATDADHSIIEEWRDAHGRVQNSFQAMLRARTRGTDIKVGERLKRKKTIYDKLDRFPKMQLGRMDDVAGCRLTFPDLASLAEFRSEIHNASFDHRLRNDPAKYDYISRPKESGYRGIHDIYEYDVRSDAGRAYRGLFIELQYRTRVQHAWATTVEVIGNITGHDHEPKFRKGDPDFENIMILASEMFARSLEGARGPLPDIADEALVRAFFAQDRKLGIMESLRELSASNHGEVPKEEHLILVFENTEDDAEILPYPSVSDALKALFELEKQRPDQDIVLVRGEGSDLRSTFQNYFNDARDFIGYVEESTKQLWKADDYQDHFLTSEEMDDLRLPTLMLPPDDGRKHE